MKCVGAGNHECTECPTGSTFTTSNATISKPMTNGTSQAIAHGKCVAPDVTNATQAGNANPAGNESLDVTLVEY